MLPTTCQTRLNCALLLPGCRKYKAFEHFYHDNEVCNVVL